MSKKKISLLLVLIMFFCVTLLTGCGSVAFSMVQYSSGQIAQTFSVKLDRQVIEQGGYDYDVSVSKVKSVLDNVMLKQKLRFQTLDETICSSVIKEQVIKDLKIVNATEKDDVIYVQMIFDNATSYRYFYNLNQEQSQNTYIAEDHAFYKKVSTVGYTKFYNFLEDEIYKQAVIEMQNYFSTSQMFSINDLDFVYCYAISQDYHMYSNADYVYYNNGLAIHAWRLTADSLDRLVVFYQIIAKPFLWYVLAVGLTFVLILLLTIIVLIKSKHKKVEANEFSKSKQLKALEEIYKKIEDGNMINITNSQIKNDYFNDDDDQN